MHPVIQEFDAAQMKRGNFDFRPGDTVRVSVRIVEGEKERIQDFEGVCIDRKRGGMNETFTVRRFSYGVGMERIFPLHSPRVEDIKVIRRGKVRRAHLGYLRNLRGKKARIAEDLVRSRKISVARKEEAAANKKAEEAAAAKAAAEAEAAAAREAEEKARLEAETAEAQEAAPQAEETEAPAEAQAVAEVTPPAEEAPAVEEAPVAEETPAEEEKKSE